MPPQSPDTAFREHPGLCQMAELHVLYKIVRPGAYGNLWRTIQVDGFDVPGMTFETMPSVLIQSGNPEYPFILVLMENGGISLGRKFELHKLQTIWQTAFSRAMNPQMNPNPDIVSFIRNLRLNLIEFGIDHPSQNQLEKTFLDSIRSRDENCLS